MLLKRKQRGKNSIGLLRLKGKDLKKLLRKRVKDSFRKRKMRSSELKGKQRLRD